MKKLLYFLLSMLSVGTILTACEETTEETEYDYWEERNAAYVDSLSLLSAGDVLTTAEADAMTVGTLYRIETEASTKGTKQYIYVKKLLSNTEGERPYFTDDFKCFYYGTFINGENFDGNFVGYSAADQGVLDGNANLPTEFDSPTTFSVSSLTDGFAKGVQYMRVGERWMMYIPYGSGYGVSGSSTIPGYSMLCFDVVLTEIVDR